MRGDGCIHKHDISSRDKLLLFLVAALFLLTGTVNCGLDAATAEQLQKMEPVQVLALQSRVDELYAVPVDENALIEAALVEQGFLRPDVPLTYELQDVAQTVCGEYSVPYSQALAVMEQESRFQVDAVSPAGCYGLMQLNPEYFPLGLTPAGNIRAGVEFLGELLAEYGDTAAALTAYHAGHDTGDREYADAVLARAAGWEVVLDTSE